MSYQIKSKLVKLLIILLLLTNFSRSSLGGVVYEVIDLEGSSYLWEREVSRWVKITRGTEIYEFQLIQFETSGHIGVAPKIEDGTVLENAKMIFNVDFPTILRLSEELFRSRSSTNIYSNRLDAEEVGNIKSNDPETNFQLAWSQTNAIFTADGEITGDQSSLDRSTSQSDSSEYTSNGSMAGDFAINILFPNKGSIVVVDYLPTTIAVSWEDTEITNPFFEIYVWPSLSKSPSKIGTTTQNYFFFPIFQKGSFNIEVRERNTFTSSVQHSFFILSSDAEL